MPKIKTSRAAAKRFKTTGTGKIVRNKAYKSSKNERTVLQQIYVRPETGWC